MLCLATLFSQNRAPSLASPARASSSRTSDRTFPRAFRPPSSCSTTEWWTPWFTAGRSSAPSASCFDTCRGIRRPKSPPEAALDMSPGEYTRALDYLYARTTGGVRFGLERTLALLDHLGNPHRAV